MIRRRTLCLLSLLVFLILCAAASVSYGAKPVSLHSIFAALGLGSGPEFEVSVVQARIPRTLFGVIAGAALGISGALMQALTRNPIADPSILGINTGASLFVVSGMAFFHISSNSQYIWPAFAGAAASTALQSLVNTVMLPDTQVMDRFCFWQTGSIGGATWADIGALWPYLAVGFIASLLLAPALNILALGDEVATGLGLNVALVRGTSALTGVLLCASVTALAGPIGFVGLMVPHFMRLLLGPDMRWVMPMSALGGGCLLLAADVLGRVLGGAGEVEVGIITALLGAPVFIFIVRKVKVRAL